MTVRGAAQITGIAPQFLVDDLDRAIAYYRDSLGFELDFAYESFYAGVSELQVRGAEVIQPLGERPWACLDFYVADLDGYILCFGERKA